MSFKTWLIHRRFRRLNNELARCGQWLENPRWLPLTAPTISAWSIAQHLEHLLLTDIFIFEHLLRIEPQSSQPRARPSLIGYSVLLAGLRQRGVAEAPRQVLPQGENREALIAFFARARAMSDQVDARLDQLAESRWSHPHHLLGHFSASQWLRFAAVHHQHHERIIDDIRRSDAPRAADA